MRKFAIVALALVLIAPGVARAELELNITPGRFNVNSQGKMTGHIKGTAEELEEIQSVAITGVAYIDEVGDRVDVDLDGAGIQLELGDVAEGQRNAKLERSEIKDHVIGYLNSKGHQVKDGDTLILLTEVELEGEPGITVYWDSAVEGGEPFGLDLSSVPWPSYTFDDVEAGGALFVNIGLGIVPCGVWTIIIDLGHAEWAIIPTPAGCGVEEAFVYVELTVPLVDRGIEVWAWSDTGFASIHIAGFELASAAHDYGTGLPPGSGGTVELEDEIVVLEKGERTGNPHNPD